MCTDPIVRKTIVAITGIALILPVILRAGIPRERSETEPKMLH